MQLNQEQTQFFADNGYLLLPDMYSPEEIAYLRRESDRITAIPTDHAIEFAGIRTVYRCHETDGPTGSEVFNTVARLPRMLGSAQQLLHDQDLYVFNSRLYGKKPLIGSAMMWHQDYGYWRLDRVPTPNLLTVMVLLGDVDVLDGCLWILPGTHKLNVLPHYADTSTPFKQWPVNQKRMQEILSNAPAPVPLCGNAGTMAIFDSLTIHASGHNFAANPRWQLYMVYNRTQNAPGASSKSRPDFICSQNTAPLKLVEDDALLKKMVVVA